MTSFAVLIEGPVLQGQSFVSALRFMQQAVEAKHVIDSVFLYRDAVGAASALIDLPSDEPNLSVKLQQFCQAHQIPLLFCITAAEKRGVCSNELKPADGYIAAGLAEFAMRLAKADKLVQFS
ncbi:sulfurtransferase complex subunit TusD [Rheinheimera sp. MM224]|uniref:sulfurtransferase complex subunit TusD n=1 Tax=Rheinheimera sp. MM224 TaxID=3019969 RepID=UPI0021F90F6D|nr:sulfurtransferase complex subunit TusD [Rheinheimera sp. MM224]CAI3799483.1 Sulfurtransferase TusD [Rheinheimera sp. MM224]